MDRTGTGINLTRVARHESLRPIEHQTSEQDAGLSGLGVLEAERAVETLSLENVEGTVLHVLVGAGGAVDPEDQLDPESRVPPHRDRRFTVRILPVLFEQGARAGKAEELVRVKPLPQVALIEHACGDVREDVGLGASSACQRSSACRSRIFEDVHELASLDCCLHCPLEAPVSSRRKGR